jgi:hypothetical protein
MHNYLSEKLIVISKLSKPERNGRFDREPNLHPVRVEHKIGPRTNRPLNRRTGSKLVKTEEPAVQDLNRFKKIT